ncbi:hypothetical protein Tcan_17088 [Toxocara canis]|uniref:Uncharacterized protein n=1 Tax=Toxocara canis TaxID=6265 RepID=A0A0B2VG18_TOXCA|nr:hypothetical protein Tcan_17088 [Toxocara canis]
MIDFMLTFACNAVMLIVDANVYNKIRQFRGVLFQARYSNLLFIICEICSSTVANCIERDGTDFVLGTLLCHLQHALDRLISIIFHWRCHRLKKVAVVHHAVHCNVITRDSWICV